jgi:hypothetical protein
MEQHENKPVPNLSEITAPVPKGPGRAAELGRRAEMARERDVALKFDILDMARAAGLVTDFYESAMIGSSEAKDLRKRFHGMDERAVHDPNLLTPKQTDDFAMVAMNASHRERRLGLADEGRGADHFEYEKTVRESGGRENVERSLFSMRQSGGPENGPDYVDKLGRQEGRPDALDQLCAHLLRVAEGPSAGRVNPALRAALVRSRESSELCELTASAAVRCSDREASKEAGREREPVFENKPVADMAPEDSNRRFEAFEKYGRVVEVPAHEARGQSFGSLSTDGKSQAVADIAKLGGRGEAFPHDGKRSKDMTRDELSERLEALSKLSGPPARPDPATLGDRQKASYLRAVEAAERKSGESARIPAGQKEMEKDIAVMRVGQASVELADKLGRVNERLRGQRQEAGANVLSAKRVQRRDDGAGFERGR